MTWEVKRLGDVCEFENGDRGTNYPSKLFRTHSGIPFINAGHLTLNGLDIDNMDYISRERYNLLGNGKIQKKDILFCLRGSLGKFASVGDLKEGAIASSLVIVRPNELIINEFLMAYFESQICADMIKNFSNGAAQPNLSAGNLKKFVISIPPLTEQLRIVAILDSAFENIALAKEGAEKNLKNANEIFESYLQSVFENKGEGWEEKKLVDICNLINGRAYNKKELLSEGKYTVLRVGNFFTNKQWYYSDLELSEDKYCEKGDLLYAWSASFGPRIWDGEKVIYHYHIWKVIPNLNLVSKEFLFIILEWDKEKIKIAQGTGTTMMHVSKGSMEERRLPLPPLEQQQSIVAKLDALSAETKKLEAIYTQKLADLEELKKSILQKAFNGELK